jgi:hypothetical protein
MAQKRGNIKYIYDKLSIRGVRNQTPYLRIQSFQEYQPQ